jgi:hypothetical protein
MTVGDPRPTRRVVDPHAGTGKVVAEGRCRACGRKGLSYLNRAHLVSKGQRGDDVEDNIVPLCGSGTSGCHGSLTDHHPASWPSHLEGAEWTEISSALRATLRKSEVKYILTKKGKSWLERVYPAE